MGSKLIDFVVITIVESDVGHVSQADIACLFSLFTWLCFQVMKLNEVEFLSSVSSFKRDVKKKELRTPDQVLEALDGLRDQAKSLGNIALCEQWRDFYRKFSTDR